ncbi:MAG: gliding motility-associated C-terminal domain-containing protein [Chitinophagales bacterium]|nr:gliding motility-associated C-terminal domain-containing protein [Chitinophagales bacterium]
MNKLFTHCAYVFNVILFCSLQVSATSLPSGGILMPTAFVIGDFCGQGTGTIDLTPDPGTPGPWAYLWSNGATTQDLSGLTAGTYFVVVTDANGVPQVLDVDVPNLPPAAPLDVQVVPTGNTSCTGPFTGALDIAPNPPGPWTFLWSTGATTEDVSGLNSGTYTVTITFGVTCSSTWEFDVPDNAGSPMIWLPPPANGVVPTSCERNDGVAGVMVAGGTQPYSFIWSNGGTNQAIQDIFAGTYTVTVTDANGCTDTETLEVGNINWPLLIEEDAIVLNPNTTCIGGNGSISIPIVHPLAQGPFSYLWSNGETTSTISNLTSGSYFVTISFNAACFVTDVIYVPHEPAIPQTTINGTPTTCGFSNGFVNLTVLPGGTPAYTYIWSNGETTQDLANVPAGSYDVTITGVNGCPFTASASIDDNPVLFSYSAQITDQTACDTTNGQIQLSLFPANLSYQWSNGATTTTLKNLAPGDYTVTISAGGTCTAVETYNVGDVTEYPVIPATPTPSFCGLANGAIDLSVLGEATAPFTFQWSNGATTEDLSGLLADTFYVTVTSAVGCTKENVVIVPNTAVDVGLQANVLDNNSCAAANGSIALEISPPDTAYVITWSGGQTTDSLANLSAGTYLVTVTLGFNCIAWDTFEITDQALITNLSSTPTDAFCGLNVGAIDLVVNTGLPPYAYIWSNAATTEDQQNLTPGTYTVTVTGANGCSDINTVTIAASNAPPSLQASPLGNTSCVAANGSIDLSVGPTGNYQYLWSDMSTTEDLSQLSPGTYTVTVTLGSCTSTGTYVVPDQTVIPSLSVAGLPAECGLANGATDLTVTTGSAPFDYLWSNTATTEDLTGITPGSYTVVVTDANGCTEMRTVIVSNNNLLLDLNAAPQANASCTAPNGSIDLAVSPAGAYNFLWSNQATTEDLSNLNNGNYAVTVTLGTCQATASFTVADQTASPVLNSAVTAAICSNSNGSIDLSVSGTSGPFDYLWSNTATSEDLNAILPGNYTVTVSAPNGCTQVATYNVANNASTFSLAAAAIPLTNCANANGAIDLNITPAGAYEFLWSNAATTEDVQGLQPGVYTVSVSQPGNCTATASYFVTDQRTNPASNQSVVPEWCGLSDASIDLTVSGGTAPYDYLWNNGQTNQDLSNVNAGTYTVVVTDQNDCTVSNTIVVPGNSVSISLAGTAASNSSCLLNNGSVDLSVNPSGNFTFQWSNQATTEDLSGLNGGTYTVTVSAGGNCTNTAVFSITNDLPSPQMTPNITAGFCGQNIGSIDLNVTGAPQPFTFLWTGGATTEDLNNLLSGVYTVVVIADNGCSASSSFTVPENTITPQVSGTPVADNSCVAINGALDLSVSPALGYTYLWSNNATTEDLNGIPAGTYAVTVNGGGACTSTAVFVVDDATTQPQTNIQAPTTTLDCGISSIELMGTISGTPNAGSYQWWSNGNPLGSGNVLNINAPGQYTLVVQDDLTFCTATASISINQDLVVPVVSIAQPAVLTCAQPGQILQGSAANGIQLSWATISGQDTTLLSNGANLPVNTAGIYYLFAINPQNQCVNAVSVNVVADQVAPTALAGSPVSLDCAGAPGILSGSANGGSGLQFAWSTSDGNLVSGVNTASAVVDQPGVYQLLVTNPNNGCTDSDLVTVDAGTPVITLALTQPSCLVETGTILVEGLTGISAPVSYVLNQASPVAQNQFAGLEPGNYDILVTGANGCTVTADAVLEPPTLLEITLDPQATVVLGYEYQLDAQLNISPSDIASVQWTPEADLDCATCLNPLASPLTNTEYRLLVVSNQGCTAEAALQLRVDKTRHIYAPNIFSPNEDGENDLFRIFGDPVNVVRIRSLQVFSRWGEQVYQLDEALPADTETGWDGTLRGQPLNPGVFVWQAVVEYIDGQSVFFKGDVTLLR